MSLIGQIQKALKSQPLKKVLPDDGLRKKYIEEIVSKSGYEKAIVIRIQPHRLQWSKKEYTTFVVPNDTTRLFQINATYRKKRIEQATYLGCKDKMVRGDETVRDLIKYQQEDGVIYLTSFSLYCFG